MAIKFVPVVEKTRVKLNREGNDDYINASHVKVIN